MTSGSQSQSVNQRKVLVLKLENINDLDQQQQSNEAIFNVTFRESQRHHDISIKIQVPVTCLFDPVGWNKSLIEDNVKLTNGSSSWQSTSTSNMIWVNVSSTPSEFLHLRFKKYSTHIVTDSETTKRPVLKMDLV
jgi:hypothetical protein